MFVVQSHIMWSWSTANSHNGTSCFLFSSLLACFTVWPCFSVVYCSTFSFVSGHTVFFFLSYIVHCNSALGLRFCANKIISYHIISHNSPMPQTHYQTYKLGMEGGFSGKTQHTWKVLLYKMLKFTNPCLLITPTLAKSYTIPYIEPFNTSNIAK